MDAVYITDPIKHMMNDYRRRCRLKNREFALGYSEFKALVTSPCFYCGQDPTARAYNSRNGKGRKKRVEHSANGIDRLDSAVGYVLDNCVSCCMQCNLSKLDFTVDEWLDHVRRLYSHQEGLGWPGRKRAA